VQPSLSASSRSAYDQQVRPFDNFPAGLVHQTRLLTHHLPDSIIHSITYQIRVLSVTYHTRTAAGESSIMNSLRNAQHSVEVEFTSIEWSPCGIYPGTCSLTHTLTHTLTHSLIQVRRHYCLVYLKMAHWACSLYPTMSSQNIHRMLRINVVDVVRYYH